MVNKMVRKAEQHVGHAQKESDIVPLEIRKVDWETVFAATAGEQMVGMASIVKADYYPLPEIYLCVSCVFVTEEYRRHRIREKLIDFANAYAKEKGFDRTYIPSEHVGLYEKYGYHYLKDIVNFGNGTDRLYVKE